MDADAARRSAHQVGLVTLPVGIALVAAPARACRLLRLGDHPGGARTIGALDLALVPGLLLGERARLWLTGRAVLNLGIAAACLRFARQGDAPGAVVAVAAMVAATISDVRAIRALPHGAGAG